MLRINLLPTEPYWKHFIKEILPFILSPILLIGLVFAVMSNKSVGNVPHEESIIPKLVRRPMPEQQPDIRFVIIYQNCDE